MRSRDLPREPDALDDLLAEVRDDLSEQTDTDLEDIVPDFAAVIEAAHARDPARVPRRALEEALALAPVFVLASESSQRLPHREQAEFGALLVEARAAVDADTTRELAALRRAGLPPAPVLQASPVPRKRWMWASAAAAALLLAVASPMLATRFQAARDTPSEAPWWQRAADSERDATWRELQNVAPQPTRERPALAEPPAPEDAIEPIIEPIIEPVIEPGAPAEPQDEPVPKARKPKVAVETLAERVRRLGGEAEAAWQSGDYAGAQRLHREVIELAPGSRAADLSYGDLFTLARQRSGPEQEKLLWREYLAAFPRGRYADDARAGLCRRAEADERSDCWQRYLTDFPTGVHRSQAARALGDAAP